MKTIEEQLQERIEKNSHQLAEKIVDLQFERQPGVWEKYGPGVRDISIRDMEYHFPFLTEAIVFGDKGIFTHYMTWVKKLFMAISLPSDAMIVALQCTREVLEQELPPEMAKLADEYLEAGIEQLNKPVKEDKPYIRASEYLGQLAMGYNECLLKGDREGASILVMNAVEKGTPVKDIYLHVFQKSQYEIGRLWLSNKRSVAKEHFCSAATQQIMSRLYPHIFSSKRKGTRFLAASIGGELHEIGIRMVADFFEMDGWDTRYLGANTPAFSINKAIEEFDPHIVGLSIAIPHHKSKLMKSIQQVREKFGGKVKIMVGGNALNHSNTGIHELGADGFAPDAEQAVNTANQLIFA
jgi:methanogenic corrinoid protein MtbC1